MSPILVRPVREQLEHDRVIRQLQKDLSRRKMEVSINPGAEQNASVGAGTRKEFPDVVLYSADKNRKVLGIIEVETGESVNHLEVMAQWAHYSRLKAPFYLYVPIASVDVVRRLATDHQIAVAEIHTYHQIGDVVRFATAYRSGTGPKLPDDPLPPDPAQKAKPVVPVVPPAPVKKSAPLPASPARSAPVVAVKAEKNGKAPARPAPVATAPPKAAPVKALPVKATAVKAVAQKAAPVKAPAAKAAPVKVAPVKAIPVKAIPVKASPAKPTPAKAVTPVKKVAAPPTKVAAAKPKPVATKVVKPAPAKKAAPKKAGKRK